MKPIWIMLIAIAIVGSFFAGKYLGQSAYQNAPQPSEPVAATPSASAPSPFAPARSSAQAHSSAPSSAAAPASQNFPERDIEESAAVENDSTGELSYAERRKRALEQFPEAQRELDDWSAVHEDVLNQQLAKVFGEKYYNARVIYDSVSENNPLLSKPLAESTLDEDMAWRGQAKANLEYLLVTYIDDPEFEILDIFCLQKKCEVTLTGSDYKLTYPLAAELLTDRSLGAKRVSHQRGTILQDTNYWQYMVVYF